MTLDRSFFTVVLTACALAGSVTAAASAADPFYERLFERGVRDLELGLADEAGDRLRTACFGFLEEPPLLAECLMYLGRAQARTGSSAELTTTAERLAELEDRFGAYSDFDGELKTEFESALRATLPEALLSRMPAFSYLAPPPPAAAIDAPVLTPKQRRKALKRQLAANPGDQNAQLSLARLDYQGGRLKSASALLEGLLAVQPDLQEAVCLRADIAIARKQCAPALDGLDGCSSLAASDRGAAFLLDCLASADRRAEAVALLESLPPERRQSREVARAAERVGGLTAASPPTAEELPDPIDEASDVQTEPQSPQPSEKVPSDSRLDASLEERLRRVRQQAVDSHYREELEAALASASELAGDCPQSARAQHLAAEIAYLGARWQLVVDYFDRGGDIPADSPELTFYLAVATYELGDARKAAEILRPALASLPRNPFVEGYLNKILAPIPP